jgi:hemoglobin-like flavoprotein
MANQRPNPLLTCPNIHNIFNAKNQKNNKQKQENNCQMGSNTKKLQKPPLEVEEAS